MEGIFSGSFTIIDVLITPTWIETDSNSSKYLLKIDPGSAFGTGLHETTRLCVREIRKRLEEGMSFLDIGWICYTINSCSKDESR